MPLASHSALRAQLSAMAAPEPLNALVDHVHDILVRDVERELRSIAVRLPCDPELAPAEEHPVYVSGRLPPEVDAPVPRIGEDGGAGGLAVGCCDGGG